MYLYTVSKQDALFSKFIVLNANQAGERWGYSKPGLNVIKLFSCSFQLSVICFLLINVNMAINDGILTFIDRIEWYTTSEYHFKARKKVFSSIYDLFNS